MIARPERRGLGPGPSIIGGGMPPASGRAKKSPGHFFAQGLKSAATYSPTWYRSTIGASELNFSVRDG